MLTNSARDSAFIFRIMLPRCALTVISLIPSSLATCLSGKPESGSASALFKMLRNIGGSIGIAGLSTLLSARERFDSERIGESVTVYSGAVQERVQQSAAYFFSQGSDLYSANMRAFGAVRRQAFLLAYSDCFLALGCFLLASAIALFFMTKPCISGAVSGD